MHANPLAVLGIILMDRHLAISRLLNASDMPLSDATVKWCHLTLITPHWPCSSASFPCPGHCLLTTLMLKPSFL